VWAQAGRERDNADKDPRSLGEKNLTTILMDCPICESEIGSSNRAKQPASLFPLVHSTLLCSQGAVSSKGWDRIGWESSAFPIPDPSGPTVSWRPYRTEGALPLGFNLDSICSLESSVTYCLWHPWRMFSGSSWWKSIQLTWTESPGMQKHPGEMQLGGKWIRRSSLCWGSLSPLTRHELEPSFSTSLHLVFLSVKWA
jgi:hypothetical protein